MPAMQKIRSGRDRKMLRCTYWSQRLISAHNAGGRKTGRKSKKTFSIGSGAKAEAIKSALNDVKLSDLADIKSFKDPCLDNVMEAMAKHRSIFKSNTAHLDKEGNIRVDKAAMSYQNFKNDFEADNAPKNHKMN